MRIAIEKNSVEHRIRWDKEIHTFHVQNRCFQLDTIIHRHVVGGENDGKVECEEGSGWGNGSSINVYSNWKKRFDYIPAMYIAINAGLSMK